MEVRDLYLALMATGMSNSQACREAGINRRTGTRWRYGRTVHGPTGPARFYAPIGGYRPAPQSISARYLSEDERMQIADAHRAGRSRRSIATELGRAPSTISRELNRNADETTGTYRPHAAHQRAVIRRARPKKGILAEDLILRIFVQRCLEKRWSPEQICAVLPTRFPGRPERHLVHETIYQALYRPGPRILARELTARLRTGRVKRRPRRMASARRQGRMMDMVPLNSRPAEVADRLVAGHLEGDLIIGKNQGSSIGTIVDRMTRFVILLHLPNGHTSVAVRDALLKTLGPLPASLRRSLTWDQGKEMARHKEFTVATGTDVYFCDPHSPWQRGTNENTNGLLRQYFPKGTNLGVHSQDHLDAVAAELNGRPRKCLGWDTPAQQMAKLLEAAS